MLLIGLHFGDELCVFAGEMGGNDAIAELDDVILHGGNQSSQ